MYQSSIRGKKKHQRFHQIKSDNYQINSECEEYAYVKKLLGNCHVNVITNSGIEAIGIIRGSLKKFSTRIVIEVGDIVVVSKRDYQANKVDIVHKYNSDQVQSLISETKLSNILSNMYNFTQPVSYEETCSYTNQNDNYVDFGYISDDSDSSNE